MNPGRKPQFLVRALTVVFALMISLVGNPAPAAERVTIATPSRGLFEFPVVVAMRKGFYKDEGIEVDKIQMQPAIGVKALMSGDVDYLLAWGSALRAAVSLVRGPVVDNSWIIASLVCVAALLRSGCKARS